MIHHFLLAKEIIFCTWWRWLANLNGGSRRRHCYGTGTTSLRTGAYIAETLPSTSVCTELACDIQLENVFDYSSADIQMHKTKQGAKYRIITQRSLIINILINILPRSLGAEEFWNLQRQHEPRKYQIQVANPNCSHVFQKNDLNFQFFRTSNKIQWFLILLYINIKLLCVWMHHIPLKNVTFYLCKMLKLKQKENPLQTRCNWSQY